MPTPFHLLTLGRLDLTRDGASVLARRRKELGLLAFLARRAPRPVDRELAMAMLWGDRPESKARVSLRQALFELRAVLGDALIAEGADLRLDPRAVLIDAAEFENDIAAGRLREAVDRWEGQFLAGLDDLGDERWTAWLEGERAGLVHRLGSALDQLESAAEAAHDWPAVIALTERHLELLPHDPAAAALLVRSYQRTGQEAKAAAARARFGLGAADPPAATGIGRPGVRGLVTPDLIGRQTTLTGLMDAWAEVEAGAGRVVVIDGVAGIGKTRLLERVVRDLAGLPQHRLVATTRGFSSQHDRPWSAIRPLLATVAAGAQGIAAVPPEVLAALRPIVPELAERFPGPASSGPDKAIDPALAIHRFLADVGAEQPVALVLDDAPDADGDSLRSLGELIRHPPAGVLLVVAGRSDAWAASGLGADLTRSGGATARLALAPLTEAQTAAMIGSAAPFSPGAAGVLAGAVHRETGGIPGLIQTVIGQLAESGIIGPGPDGAWTLRGSLAAISTGGDSRALVRDQTASLPADSRRLLDLAAVIGPRISTSRLERASRLGPDQYQRALGVLLTGRHLREPPLVPSRLEFPSEAVRKALYHAIAPSIRAALHRLAADTAEPRSDPESLAEYRRHRDAAGRAPRSRWVPVAAVLAALVAVALGWRAWAGGSARQAPGTPVLLADVSNSTGEALFDGSLGVAARVGLQQSGRVWIVPRNQIVEALTRMGRPDSGLVLRGELAREVAVRENVPLVVEMDVAGDSSGYLVTARLVDAATGRDIKTFAVRPSDREQVLEGVTDLVDRVRRALGEEPGDLRPNDRLPQVTTRSLVALQQFALGDAAWDRRDWDTASRYWERAAQLDSTFSLAHVRLAGFHFWNQNDRPAALAELIIAERFADRLTEPERLGLVEVRARVEGNAAGATEAAGMLASRFPTPANVFNHGNALLRNRRCVEALPVFRRAIALRPTAPTWINLATCYQFLDSLEPALAAYREAGTVDSTVLFDSNINQEWGTVLIRLGRPLAAESAFRRMADRPGPGNQARGLRSLAYLAMYQGRYREALGFLDASLAKYRATGPGSLSIVRNLVLSAHASASLGNPRAAATHLAAAATEAKTVNLDPVYYGRMVAAHIRIGDRDGAGRWLRQLNRVLLQSSRSDSVALRFATASLAIARRDYRAALRQLAPDPVANPVLIPTYWAARGEAYAALDRPDSALAAWRTARGYWGGGSEDQDGWDRVPLRMAEAALALGDTVAAKRLLGDLTRQWERADSLAVDPRRARDLARLLGMPR